MIYISSKMSGLPDYNRQGFIEKQAELMLNGFDVWNPAYNEPDWPNPTWGDYLADDILALEQNCNAIYMFGKWYRSQGSCVELLTAHRLGYEIHIETWWLKWVPTALNVIFKCKTKGFNND